MRILSELRERLRAILSRGREDRELDEELAFHIESQAQENVRAGMTPEEARRQAHLRLGGAMQVREATRDARGLGWLDDLGQDLRYAVRTFGLSPGFAAAAVLTLALGIGATTAIFSVVHPLLLDPLPFEGGDRLVQLVYADPTSGMTLTPPGSVSDALRRDARSLEAIEAYAGGEFQRAGPEGAELVSGMYVSHTFLDMLNLRPALGRAFTRDELHPDADVVMLGHGYWQRAYGGRPDVVGRTIELDGRPRVIIGVMPARLAAFAARDVWAPLYPTPGCVRVGCGMLHARLRPGVPDSVAARELNAIAERVPAELRLDESWGDDWVVRLVRPQDRLRGGLEEALRVLAVAVGLVLLIAAANVAHLLLARGVVRQREIAMRGALGAGRMRIARQLLTESALLAAGGGAAGLLFAHWGLGAILGLRPAGLEALDRAGIGADVLVFSLAVSLFTVLLFGLAPALRAGRIDPAAVLRAGPAGTADRAGVRSRRALIVAEVALTIVLLVGAGLLTRGLIRLQATDPGFRSEGLLAVRLELPEARYASASARATLRDALIERLREAPGIAHATVASSVPPRYGYMRATPEIDGGRSPEESLRIDGSEVRADYFRTFGIRIIEGRGFTEAEVERGTPVVVVSRSLARRLWPQGGAIGRRVRLLEPLEWLTVVGVAADIATGGLVARTGAPRFQFHRPFVDPGRLGVLIVRAEDGTEGVAQRVRTVLRSVAPDVPVREIASLDALLGRTIAGPRFNAALLAVFAALALGLAAVGLYGVLAYAVGRRTREIGIRKAVGAPRGAIVRSVLGEALVPVSLGTALGLVGALAAGRAIESLLYGFPAHDPLTLLAAAVVILATTIVASLAPARRALRVDAMITLRAE